MSRRSAACFLSLFAASVAVLGLTGCGGGHEASAPKETPAPQAKEEPPPAPTATPAPPTPAEAAPVALAAGAALTEAPSAPSPTPNPTPAPTEKPVDALQWLKDSEARKADYQRRLAEAEASVANSIPPVAEWERNVLAFKNPFLKRPQLSPEDAQTIVGMDGVARVQWAEGRLAEKRAARDAAQKALDDLKANPPLN
jgi:hypothetical protein